MNSAQAGAWGNIHRLRAADIAHVSPRPYASALAEAAAEFNRNPPTATERVIVVAGNVSFRAARDEMEESGGILYVCKGGFDLPCERYYC